MSRSNSGPRQIEAPGIESTRSGDDPKQTLPRSIRSEDLTPVGFNPGASEIISHIGGSTPQHSRGIISVTCYGYARVNARAEMSFEVGSESGPTAKSRPPQHRLAKLKRIAEAADRNGITRSGAGWILFHTFWRNRNTYYVHGAIGDSARSRPRFSDAAAFNNHVPAEDYTPGGSS
jgi:hypothetical protein